MNNAVIFSPTEGSPFNIHHARDLLFHPFLSNIMFLQTECCNKIKIYDIFWLISAVLKRFLIVT